MLLLSVLVVVLAVGAGGAAALTFRSSGTSATTGRLAIAASTTSTPRLTAAAAASSSKAGLAIDGDLATGSGRPRSTGSRTFGTKPGVGLVLDLGSVRDVLGDAAFGRTRHRPEGHDPCPGRRHATDEGDWKPVEEAKNVADSAELSWTDSVRTRFLLVYLTALPAIGDGQYQGGISEVTVSGH